MADPLQSPTLRRILDDLGRRLGILERRTTTAASSTGTTGGGDITFSYAGTLTVSGSPPVLIRNNCVLSVLAVALGTAGSTATVLTVKRNTTVIATVTVPSSSTAYNADIGVAFTPEQKLSVQITTAGTAAANMGATARFT